MKGYTMHQRIKAIAAAAAIVVATVVGAASPASAAITLGGSFDYVKNGVSVHMAYPYQWLNAGDAWVFGHSRLVMQFDGNLVIYRLNDNGSLGNATWASGTAGRGATQMLFQPDGNLVLYTAGGAAVWASQTNARCVYGLTPTIGLQADSNFVIYCTYHATNGDIVANSIWATNTIY
jgi:hypothetical protein